MCHSHIYEESRPAGADPMKVLGQMRDKLRLNCAFVQVRPVAAVLTSCFAVHCIFS